MTVAFAPIVLFSNPAMGACRWREQRVSGCDLRRRWYCVACSAKVFTSDAAARKICHAPARNRRNTP